MTSPRNTDPTLDEDAGFSAADLLFDSGRWTLRASGGYTVNPVFGDDPVGVAGGLVDELRRVEARTGDHQVLCGLIPFDVNEPAHLRITGDAQFVPRRYTVNNGSSDWRETRRPPVPDDPEYRTSVRRALDAIGAKEVDKVVLSRVIDYPLPPGASHRDLAETVRRRLTATNPGADVFRCGDATGAVWVGASPEVIADVRSGHFLTHPLAGSLPRTVPEEVADEHLHSSDKDLREHAFVVRHIVSALSGVCGRLSYPERPTLFSTDTMWHLGSRIQGDLVPGMTALEAAVSVHPTPAVCGTPTGDAAKLIRSLERTGREFYSGLVGWTDSSGDGRWALVLRGARITGDTLRLQAGAGIVEGSTPDAEHAETAAKFGTVSRCLAGLF
ncbi:Isochorismate synthase DhbC [Corynebacterium provencense]|uniref:Isochorismate synthase DhbC n=1 Tax=Corynebacterium provencense TaxID=1737425 RepID=A0A2Z3Z1G6_9CORY|nr:chorismate-binding protein [Corynebacterium provencense]AWT27443.1 Isochorismate synthase DhbC [Corynebacterium provencense]